MKPLGENKKQQHAVYENQEAESISSAFDSVYTGKAARIQTILF